MQLQDADVATIGRPRSFDRAEALHAAMLVFWRYGYEGASLSALTQAMNISAPSLYAAFRDKQSLFIEAAHLYAGDNAALAEQLGRASSAKIAAMAMLTDAARAFTGRNTPPGCMLASATASGSTASVDAQKAVASMRRATRELLRKRIEQDIASGSLPTETSAAAWADVVVAVVQGMSVLARDGETRKTLMSLADNALAGWPERTSG